MLRPAENVARRIRNAGGVATVIGRRFHERRPHHYEHASPVLPVAKDCRHFFLLRRANIVVAPVEMSIEEVGTHHLRAGSRVGRAFGWIRGGAMSMDKKGAGGAVEDSRGSLPVLLGAATVLGCRTANHG